MARKVVNRKGLREESEAADRLGAGDKNAAKPKAVGEKPKRKSRAKVVKEVRLRALWGVFNQSLKRVATFDYSQRAEADKKARDLSESQRTPHFVQLVKERIE